MSVIVVSKKAYNAFKKYSIVFGAVAALSIGANIILGFHANEAKTEAELTREKLIQVSEELQAKTEENKQLTDKIEKRKIAMVAMSSEVECLARNIYFEAGAESYRGKQAVAHVTLNRMKSGEFPKRACDVVYQGANDGAKGCQFSWACDGMNKAVAISSKTWQESKAIAIAVLAGTREAAHDVTNGALYFHATHVKPRWASKEKMTVKIDNHIFYK